MTVNRKAFQSQYGFNSPGFEVDAGGNIIATYDFEGEKRLAAQPLTIL